MHKATLGGNEPPVTEYMQVKKPVSFSVLDWTEHFMYVMGLTAPSHRHCCPQFAGEETGSEIK